VLHVACPLHRSCVCALGYIVNEPGNEHVAASCARAAYQALVDAGVTFLDTAEGDQTTRLRSATGVTDLLARGVPCTRASGWTWL
jgi:hypothetical protein